MPPLRTARGGYVLALVAVLAATVLRWPMHPFLGSVGFFALYLVAITVSARFAGLGPALLATALAGGLGAVYYTRYGDGPGITDVELVQLLLSVGLGLVISALLESQQRAQQRIATAEAENERLLAEALEARAAAEAANRTKDEFLSTVSHELRTPLNSIAGWTQLIRMQPDAPTIDRGLEVIARSVQAQDRLIHDLLDVSRIVAGKLRLELAETNLAPLVAAALDGVRPSAITKGVQLHSSLGGDCRVLGDPPRLQQVASNLLSNAVKFTPRGGTVRLELARRDGRVELTVRDDGEGIEPDVLPHVFERFQQGDSSRHRQQGGLGLGLAIARHLTELHGGRIDAASPGPRQGATFSVTLPAITAAATAGEARARFDDDATVDERSRLSGVRVLLVDDNQDARELAARTLAHAAAEVETAASAEEGLVKLRRFRPHVLLSDIEMPLQDGYEFLARVRSLPDAEGGAVPAAAITAFAGAEDRRRALAAGFAVHLAKPVAGRTLIGAVTRLAQRTSDTPHGAVD